MKYGHVILMITLMVTVLLSLSAHAYEKLQFSFRELGGKEWQTSNYSTMASRALKLKTPARFCILLLASRPEGRESERKQRQALDRILDAEHPEREYFGLTLVTTHTESTPATTAEIYGGPAPAAQYREHVAAPEVGRRVLGQAPFAMLLVDGTGQVLARTEHPLLREDALLFWLEQGAGRCSWIPQPHEGQTGHMH